MLAVAQRYLVIGMTAVLLGHVTTASAASMPDADKQLSDAREQAVLSTGCGTQPHERNRGSLYRAGSVLGLLSQGARKSRRRPDGRGGKRQRQRRRACRSALQIRVHERTDRIVCRARNLASLKSGYRTLAAERPSQHVAPSLRRWLDFARSCARDARLRIPVRTLSQPARPTGIPDTNCNECPTGLAPDTWIVSFPGSLRSADPLITVRDMLPLRQRESMRALLSRSLRFARLAIFTLVIAESTNAFCQNAGRAPSTHARLLLAIDEGGAASADSSETFRRHEEFSQIVSKVLG